MIRTALAALAMTVSCAVAAPTPAAAAKPSSAVTHPSKVAQPGSAAASTYSGPLGSPFYDWTVIERAQSTATPLDLVFPRTGVTSTGKVGFLGDHGSVESVYAASSTSVGLSIASVPWAPHAAGAIAASPGVAVADNGAIGAAMLLSQSGTGSTGDSYHLQRLSMDPATAPVELASGGSGPPFAHIDRMPAVDSSGQVAFTATTPAPGGALDLYTAKNLTGSGATAADYNAAGPPTAHAAALAMDDDGQAVLQATPAGGGAQILLYRDYQLTNAKVVASSRPSDHAVCGSSWSALGGRPAVSADGTVIAFGATDSAGHSGIWACINRASRGWYLQPVAGGTRTAELGFDKSDNPIGLGFAADDLNSSVTVVREPARAGHSGADLADASITVGFVATPRCTTGTCPADASPGHVISPGRGIWAVQLVPGTPVELAGGPQPDPPLIPHYPTPVVQTGDHIAGDSVTMLDASAGGSLSTPVWFSMAADPLTGADTNSAGNNWVSVVVRATDAANTPETLLLRGLHQDTDGDELPDHWENQGIDFDGNGHVDYTLGGAQVDHRDLYLDWQAMNCTAPCTSMVPSTYVRQLVEQAYAAAPLPNPDGKPGITLHLLRPPAATVAYAPFVNTGSDGTVRSTAPTYDAIRAAAFLNEASPERNAAKGLAVRFLLSADQDADNDASSGSVIAGATQVADDPNDAHWRWGSLGAITELGSFQSIMKEPLTDKLFAQTAFHELGHSLGLHHGGYEGTGCKPNYQSAMNYMYQDAAASANDLTYSSTDLRPLNEAALDETSGVPGTSFPVLYGVGGVQQFSDPLIQKSIDWNGDGTIAPTVSADINWVTTSSGCDPSPKEVLNGRDDWQTLQYLPFWGISSQTLGTRTAGTRAPRQTGAATDSAEETLAQWGAADSDGDGVPNGRDNCPYVVNPGQQDARRGVAGEACATTVTALPGAVGEGDTGQHRTLQFPVVLDGAVTTSPVTLTWATQDGTARAGIDYTAASGTLTVPAGQSSATISVSVIGNNTVQPSRSLLLHLSAATGAGLMMPALTPGTIVDDDPYVAPVVTTADAATTASLTAPTAVAVAVHLSAVSRRDVTVAYRTVHSTAVGGTDYTSKSGTVTVAAGSTSGTVSIPILGASQPHPPITFKVAFTDPVNATLGTPATSTVTIATPQSPAAPVVSGAPGSAQTTLTWTAPNPGTSPVTGYTVYRGTTTGAEALLVRAAAGTTTYVDNGVTNGVTYFYEVTATSSVGESPRSNEVALTPAAATVPAQPVLAAKHGNGKVTLKWAKPASGGAAISGYQVLRSRTATGETQLVRLSASATSYTDSAVTNGTVYYYELTALNSFGSSPVSTQHAATPSAPASAPALTAVAGKAVNHLYWERPGDTGGPPVTGYTVLRGTTAGGEKAVATVSATTSTYDDATAANGTTYFYEVTATTAAGTGTASTERSAAPSATAKPSVYLGDASVTAPTTTGNATLSFPLALSQPATSAVSVHVSTGSSGTALPGSDYVGVDTTVTFAAGTTQASAAVPVLGFGLNGDGTYQGAVTVELDVDTPSAGVLIARDAALGSIASHNAPPTLSVAAATANENAGHLSFTATLNAASAIDTTVRYATSNGTAGSGTNYTATTGTLTIPAGATTATVTVPVVNSNGSGPPRTLQLVLYAPAGASIVHDIVGATITLTSNGQTACQVATMHWVGTDPNNANWSTAGNWSKARVPGPGDIVCVDGGVRSTVDHAFTITALGTTVPLTVANRLTLASTSQSSQLGSTTLLDRIPNAAELDVAGTLDLTAGTLYLGSTTAPVDNSGQANLGGTGTVIVRSGATLRITAGACSYRYSQDTDVPHQGGCTSVTPALRNDGTVTVSSGLLQRDSTAPIVNDATLNLAGPDIGDPTDSALTGSVQGGCVDEAQLDGFECGTFPFSNTGLIQRTAGPGTSTIAFTDLTTTGTVHALGHLRLVELGNATAGGTWQVDAGSELDFEGPGTLTLPTASALTGAGAVETGYYPYLTGGVAQHLVVLGTFTPGAILVHGGEIDLPRATSLHTLALQSGTLGGAGGVTVLAGGSATITGGAYAAAGGLTVSSSDGTSAAATYTSNGGTWSSPGALTWQPGVNAAITATLTMTAGRLVNQGRLTITNASISASGGAMTNSGTLTTLGGNGNNPVGFFVSGSVDVAFTNLGAVLASSTGLTELDGYAGGSGSLHVTSNVLVLRPRPGVAALLGGGAVVASGATLDLSNTESRPTGTTYGSFTVPAGKTIAGAGALSIGRYGSSVDVDLEGTDSLPTLSTRTDSGHQVTLGTSLTLTALSAEAPSGNAGFTGPGSITLPSGATGSFSSDFSGNGAFTVADGATLNWSGGTMSGTGATTFAAGSVVAMAAVGVGGTRTLSNAGALAITGGGLTMSGGSFVNSGTITFSGGNGTNPVWIREAPGVGVPFVNNGTITGVPGGPYGINGYNGGTGTLSLDTSSMSLTPYTGKVVTLPSTTMSNGGSLVLGETSATALARGSFVLPAAESISGTGTLSVVDSVNVDLEGTDDLAGLNVKLGAGYTLTLAHPVTLTSFTDQSGTITGPGNIEITGTATGNLLAGDILGSGNLTVANHATLLWNNGTLAGSGTFTVDAGGTLTTQIGAATLSRTTVNNGTMAMAWGLRVAGGSITNNASIAMAGGNSVNNLVIADTTDAGVPFTNNGTISTATGGPYEIDGYAGGTGTMTIAGNSSMALHPFPGSTAAVPTSTVSAGSSLVLGATTGSPASPGAFVLASGHALTGGGTLQIDGAVNVALSGTDSLPGLIVRHLGSTDALTLNSNLSLSSFVFDDVGPGGSTITGPGNITIASGTGNLSGGNLAGAGVLTIASGATLNWTAGTMGGAGQTVIAAGGTVKVPTPVTLAGTRRLTNNGALTLTSPLSTVGGSIVTGTTGVTTLLAGNEFNPVYIAGPNGTAVPFTNNGSVVGNGAYSVEIDGYTGGTGSVTVTTSQLVLRPLAAQTAQLGNATISSGAVLALTASPGNPATPGGFALPAGRSITGAGTLIVDTAGTPGTSITVTLAGTVSVANLYNRGTLLLGTSHVTLTGLFQQFPSGVLGTTLASATSFGSVIASGTATLAGTLVVTRASGYIPPVGTSFSPVVGGNTLSGVFTTVTPPTGETLATTYSATGLAIERAT